MLLLFLPRGRASPIVPHLLLRLHFGHFTISAEPFTALGDNHWLTAEAHVGIVWQIASASRVEHVSLLHWRSIIVDTFPS